MKWAQLHGSLNILWHCPSLGLKWKLTFPVFHCEKSKSLRIQAKCRKGRGTRCQIVNIHWIIKKAREFRKKTYFCFIDYARAFVWITTNCGKFWKRWESQTTWPASWEICIQVREQQLELAMEQQTGTKWGSEYVKAVYCHPAYLTYIQSISWETLG